MGIIGVSGGGIWLCPVTGTVCDFGVGFVGAWSLVTNLGWRWRWSVRVDAQVHAAGIGGADGGTVGDPICHSGSFRVPGQVGN